MDKKFLNKLSTLLLYFSILAFIISFGFAHNPPSGWYQQFMPNLNGRSLTDITFLDSLIGFAVTDGNSINDGYIIKTTNGGDNWTIKYSQNVKFNKVQFINSTTGFVDAYVDLLFKTTNAGDNWFTINLPSDLFSDDMWVLNEDTIWLAQSEALVGGLFRTTNAGQNWIRQYYAFGNNPHKIYMFNGKMGFMYNEKDSLFKTTNSGLNWFRVPGGAFTDIYFIDSLVGWKANIDFKITSDGGLSWIEVSPFRGIVSFDNINTDTIWGSGGGIFFPGVGSRGIVLKSTDKGLTWRYQLPDTSFGITNFTHIQFSTDSIGWAYLFKTGIKTFTGGDSTFLVGINHENNNAIINYNLNQNYPNPFNPVTIISYELSFNSYIELSVFNILGKEIQKLVNEKQYPGSYNINFNGSNLPSGIYFYSLKVNNELIDTKKMILIK